MSTTLSGDTESRLAATVATYASTFTTTQVAALNTVAAQITAADVAGTADYAAFGATAFAELVNKLNLAAGQPF